MQILRYLGAGVAVALAGCGAGDGENLDSNGRPLGEAQSSIALTASLESLQANLFTPNCALSGCHGSGGAQLGLNLSAGATYDNLVGVASVEQPGVLRIAPGNADASYLVRKLEGQAGISGERMPLDRPALSTELITTLRQWIDAGARPEGGNTGTVTAPEVAAVQPPDQGVVNSLPASIRITFSAAMDASTLADVTVVVERSGGDNSFGDGNEVRLTPASITLDTTTQLLANIDLAGSPDTADLYRLTLSGTGPAVVRDALATVIDGDGDGSPGGDFNSSFSVDPTAVAPTFASLQQTLFTPTCATAGCHSGASPAGQMNLEPGNAYAALLDPSRTLRRVTPGDPDNSLVVDYLESGFMPLTKPPGFDAQRQTFIDALREWINAGAPEQ